jgi:ferredoxin
MKMVIDYDLCEGCGSCVEVCPDAIEMRDDEKAYVIAEDCSSCDCDEAVGICPTEAITLED